MKKLLILSIVPLLFIVMSCSSGSEDDNMSPDLPLNNVTYTGTIKAIIDGACLNCHIDPPINGAPMPLLSLANVQEAVQNRGLIGRVENGSMPPTGDDLTPAQVQDIKDWQAGGFN